MAWQYTEYADYPYLSDWVRKEWKFAVESREDIANVEEREMLLPGEGARPITTIGGNGILRPVFYKLVA